jgi:hypothetical protein
VSSKLDPFKEEIERLMRSDHRIPAPAGARQIRTGGLLAAMSKLGAGIRR